MAGLWQRWQSPVRVLFVVVVVVAALLAPIIWSSIREHHRRAETARKLQQFGDALKLPNVEKPPE